MPVKGKTTKSRTAKSKGKGLKLKWWYILPVIAIVAVAGYAIVRYSQAAQERGVLSGLSLRGGTGWQNKGGRQVKVVGYNSPVNTRVNWQPPGDGLRGKWVCAEVWVGNRGQNVPGIWGFELKSYGPDGSFPKIGQPIGTQLFGSSQKVYTKLNGWDRQCVRIIQNTPETDGYKRPVYFVDVVIKNLSLNSKNFLGVSKVWWQDNL
jgi:hypothetical protein